MADKQRIYAKTDHPNIYAVIAQKFIFKTQAQAMEKFQHLADHFVQSRDKPQSDTPLLRIWIRGFAVTEAEQAQGYKGHFALISIGQRKDKTYFLQAEKDLADLEKHPQKARAAQAYPDWGHPVLRHLKKDPVFETITHANAVLQGLHASFPTTSIPGENKLYAMVYRKSDDTKTPPITKYVFEIELAEKDGAEKDGYFKITWKENTHQKKKPAKQAPTISTTPADQTTPKGRFTSMVALKRNKKK
jgi:hypothetical protein